jgi:uncharacterized protein
LRQKIRINSAFLFGSFAKGNYNEWSDIDVALVSDDFIGNRFLDKDRIRRITLDIDFRLSPMPFNTADFEVTNLFVKEILSSGIKII